MNILNKLIEDLLSRSEVRLSEASFTIGLENNAIKVAGEVPVTVLDTEKPGNPKTLANLVLPIKAKVEIKEVTFPIPSPK